MKNIIFIAPPAAGKGTISDFLVKNNNYVHLSTGDLLRDEVQSGSKFGKEIDAIISKGNLVSDDIMIELVKSKLQELTNKAFILDGFPRTLNQAMKLDEMLRSLGINNNVAIYLNVSEEEATKRATSRIICPSCKKSYNLYYQDAKPKVEGICDDCGTLLQKRSDDTEESFKVRFETYLENTAPILDYYKEKGILEEIDAMASKDVIANKLLNEILPLSRIRD